MVSTESLALSLSQATDLDLRRRRGLELFCLSFLALFLELMVIRWAPAVVRLIAYYANLMLISSFLGLGVGALVGKTRKSVFGWLPALLLVNIAWLLIAHFVTMPTSGSESRFYTSTPYLVRYLCLVGKMVLAANLVAMRMSRTRTWPYAPLIATLLLLYLVKRDSVLALSFDERLLWSLLVVPLPIFFAGLIFSTTFRTAVEPIVVLRRQPDRGDDWRIL